MREKVDPKVAQQILTIKPPNSPKPQSITGPAVHENHRISVLLLEFHGIFPAQFYEEFNDLRITTAPVGFHPQDPGQRVRCSHPPRPTVGCRLLHNAGTPLHLINLGRERTVCGFETAASVALMLLGMKQYIVCMHDVQPLPRPMSKPSL